jgi:microcystin-dependent protein
MAMSLKHAFHSTKDDGTDTNLVRPTDWNAEHTITSSAGVVLGRPVGATPATGPVAEIAIPTLLGSVMPPGVIMAYGGLTAPTGWLLCNGTSYAVATYSALAGVIGYQFGGSGASFNVPNLQGRVPAGAGGSLLNISGLFNKLTVGGIGGAQSIGLAAGHLPAHSHTVTDPKHGHELPKVAAAATGGAGNVQYQPGGNMMSADQVFTVSSYTGISVGGGGSGAATGAAHLNVQPTLLVNYIIKT